MLRARGEGSAFPSAQIMLDGWMENALMSEPATAVEDRYREILRDSRARDAAAGRTLDGPHLTDLQVIYAPKNMPARDASTGEQKALLIGLVLAHASLVAEMTGITPLLLLDEVVAHLDPAQAHGAVRRTRKTRRAGLDDRRRPARLHRYRRVGRDFRRRFRPDCSARQGLRLRRPQARPRPRRGLKIALSVAGKWQPDRAFAIAPKRLSAALKNHQKIPFIQ